MIDERMTYRRRRCQEAERERGDIHTQAIERGGARPAKVDEARLLRDCLSNGVTRY